MRAARSVRCGRPLFQAVLLYYKSRSGCSHCLPPLFQVFHLRDRKKICPFRSGLLSGASFRPRQTIWSPCPDVRARILFPFLLRIRVLYFFLSVPPCRFLKLSCHNGWPVRLPGVHRWFHPLLFQVQSDNYVKSICQAHLYGCLWNYNNGGRIMVSLLLLLNLRAHRWNFQYLSLPDPRCSYSLPLLFQAFFLRSFSQQLPLHSWCSRHLHPKHPSSFPCPYSHHLGQWYWQDHWLILWCHFHIQSGCL